MFVAANVQQIFFCTKYFRNFFRFLANFLRFSPKFALFSAKFATLLHNLAHKTAKICPISWPTALSTPISSYKMVINPISTRLWTIESLPKHDTKCATTDAASATKSTRKEIQLQKVAQNQTHWSQKLSTAGSRERALATIIDRQGHVTRQRPGGSGGGGELVRRNANFGQFSCE